MRRRGRAGIVQRISAVCKDAIAAGRAEVDLSGPMITIMARLKKGRQPAITDLGEARGILARTEATPAHPVTVLAVRLLALTVVPPGTLIGTLWTEFAAIDKAAAVWQVPAARMKLRLHPKDDETRGHIIPSPGRRWRRSRHYG